MKVSHLVAISILMMLKPNLGLPLSAHRQEQGLTKAPDARDILMKATEAAGGLRRFKQLDNFSIKTHNVIFQPNRKTDLTITEVAQLPDKSKQIWTLELGQRIQVLNGNHSWKQLNGEVSNLSEAEKREMQRGLLRLNINVLKMSVSESLSVDYMARETLGGKSNYVLQIKNESGDFFRLYIDAESYLIAKKSYQGAPEVGLATLEEVYSDYRKVDGIKIPFHTEVKANGRRFIETDVLEAKFNLALEDDFFFRP